MIFPEKTKEPINNWISESKKSKLHCFHKFTKTLEHHKKKIINYFKDRQNSGFVEGINNKIKVTKRRCYGLASKESFFRRLFLDFSGYQFFGLSNG